MTDALRIAPIDYPFPEKPAILSAERSEFLTQEIKRLLVANNATLIAHYYTDPIIQALAEETGGCVSDSLEMARFGRDAQAETLIVAGVRFMGETAKILSPEKKVLMPTLEASNVGIKTFFSGERILAVSPIKRTPATINVSAWASRPNRAISKESETQPPVSSANA